MQTYEKRQLIARQGALKHLTGAQVKVLYAIETHANNETGIAWPGAATLAKETGLSEESVRKARKALIAKGFLRQIVAGGGRNKSMKVQLLVPPSEGEGKIHDAGNPKAS